MELLEFEIEYNQPDTFGTVPRSVHECIASSAASSRHRLAAATLAMISADNHGDENTATAVFQAVQRIEPRTKAERIYRSTTDAIFHSGFGNLDLARRLLHDLVTEAQTVPHPAARAAHIRRASFGIARYDSASYAGELLSTSLTTFEKLGLWTQAVLCVEDLGTIAIAGGRYDEARHWIARADEMKTLGNDVFSASVEYELRVLLAFETMDSSVLPQSSLPAEVSEAFLRPARSRQTHFALLGARMIVAENYTMLESVVAELRVLHERMKRRGYQDHTTAVLSKGLCQLGRADDAAAVMSEYLRTDRRERVQLPHSLKRAAIELGIQVDDSAKAGSASLVAQRLRSDPMNVP
jgi:hypothetical protein